MVDCIWFAAGVHRLARNLLKGDVATFDLKKCLATRGVRARFSTRKPVNKIIKGMVSGLSAYERAVFCAPV